MKITKLLILILSASNFIACGQIGNHEHTEMKNINYDEITNANVRHAIETWQKADSEKWFFLFTKDATLYDDGNPRNFLKFSTKAIGNEYFTSIDKIEDNSLSVYGKLHSDTWGDFKTYFKFHSNENGKFYKLEIGQAE
ncbi:hypothetical protein KO500_16875 [Cellulophaga baltica]|uniref:hypothetical protein n=1 Tax=Cellulophaga TaxID=104264 RepID=UPI001C06EB70|nr:MULTISPECIES: hypothetical protein [Cellulophaga]MBU2998115.1 hypothetical protein [Cellulophaga baltica]MDO6769519.1 hypothetical protein [Cellulophaga sp. 1_MG-2023]